MGGKTWDYMDYDAEYMERHERLDTEHFQEVFRKRGDGTEDSDDTLSPAISYSGRPQRCGCDDSEKEKGTSDDEQEKFRKQVDEF